MLFDQAQARLRVAAAPVLSRIQAKSAAAPLRLRPALLYLATHLFEPSLQVRDLKRACTIRDNSFSSQFKAAIGEAPGRFLSGCRLQVGANLLLQTSLTLGQIAEGIGYGSLHSFSTAFERWSGLRPSAYRKRASAAEGAVPADSELLDTGRLRRAVLGCLDRAEAEPLLQHLRDLYPELAEPGPLEEPVRLFPPEVPLIQDAGAEAEATWALLREQTFSEARMRLLRHPELCTAHLVNLLRRQGRTLGRRHRRRGLAVTMLAMECLQIFKSRWRVRGQESVREVLHLEIRVGVWLANAYRLALLPEPADRLLAVAAAQLPADPERKVLAELLGYLGAIRWYQRRFREGLALERRAIALFRLLGEPVPLAEALLTEGGLYLSRGQIESGLGSLEEGLTLLCPEEEPALALGGAVLLGRARLALGQQQAAKRSFCQALEPAQQLGKLRGLSFLARPAVGR